MLEVPIDRIIQQQDPGILNIPIPRLNIDPNVEQIVGRLSKDLAVCIYRNQNNPCSIYLYNLISLNNWNNREWVELLTFAGMYITVTNTNNVNVAEIADIYTSGLVARVRELQRSLDQNTIMYMERRRREYDSILQNYRGVNQQSMHLNNRYSNPNNNNTGNQSGYYNGYQHNNNSYQNNRPNNYAGQQNQGNNANVSFGNFNSNNTRNNVSSNIGTSGGKYSHKGVKRNKVQNHILEDTNVNNTILKESIPDPVCKEGSEYPPLIFSGWERRKVVDDNNKYTWEIKMNEDEHKLSKDNGLKEQQEEAVSKITSELSFMQTHETIIFVVESCFDECLTIVKLAALSKFKENKGLPISRGLVSRTLPCSNNFRYSSSKLLTDLFKENKNFTDISEALDILASDFKNDRRTMKVIDFLDNYLTNCVNEYLKKYFNTGMFIDSFREDINPLIGKKLTISQKKQLGLYINELADILATNSSVVDEKTLDTDIYYKDTAVSTFVEKYSFINVNYSLKELDLEDLHTEKVLRVSNAINPEFHKYAALAIKTKYDKSFLAVKTFILTNDDYRIEVSKRHGTEDILLSLED